MKNFLIVLSLLTSVSVFARNDCPEISGYFQCGSINDYKMSFEQEGETLITKIYRAVHGDYVRVRTRIPDGEKKYDDMSQESSAPNAYRYYKTTCSKGTQYKTRMQQGLRGLSKRIEKITYTRVNEDTVHISEKSFAIITIIPLPREIESKSITCKRIRKPICDKGCQPL